MTTQPFTLGETQWRDRLKAFWLAWKYVLVLALLLAGSLFVNYKQFTKHVGYKAAEKERIERLTAEARSTQMEQLLSAIGQVGQWKASDDAELMAQLDAIEGQRSTHTVEYRNATIAAPLPPQCAPGPGRVNAINRALGPQQ